MWDGGGGWKKRYYGVEAGGCHCHWYEAVSRDEARDDGGLEKGEVCEGRRSEAAGRVRVELSSI